MRANTIDTLLPREEEIVYGSLLGDGYLKRTIGRNCTFGCTQGLKNYAYIDWLEQELQRVRAKQYGCKIPANSTVNKICQARMLWTSAQPIFTTLRQQFYGSGSKVITIEILEKLTPVSLAVWYMDDGCYSKYHEAARLCTEGYTFGEVNLMSEYFQSKWQLKTYVCQNRGCKKGGSWYLEFSKRSTTDFFSLIRSHVLPCMQYKLGVGTLCAA